MRKKNIDTDPLDGAYPNPAYANYVLGILMVAYVFSFIDRQILSLMVGPIKADLGIGDFQFSLLTGWAFALFYAFMGIPLGRMADHRSRRTIIAVGVAVWSLMTCLSGMAKSFTALFMARVGVGVGEAALSPPVYSLLSDYYPPHRLARANSIYTMGVTVGTGLAFIIGGLVSQWIANMGEISLPLVGEVRAWQATFFAVGLPGILIVLLMLTVKEPRRRGLMAVVKSGGDRRAKEKQADSRIPLREVAAYVWRNRKAYSSILYTIPIISILGYAYMGWYPEFLLRTYQVDGGMHGIITGVIYLVFGTASTLGGAWFSEWLTRKGYRDANVRLLFLVGVSLFVPAVVGPLMPTMTLALLFGVPAICLLNCYFGVAMAGLNRITPNQMRAQLVAFLLFLSNILGLGFGTSFVAGLTEFLFADDNALNYSLSMVGGIVSVLTAMLAWRGLPHYRAALGQSQEIGSQTDPGFEKSPALG